MNNIITVDLEIGGQRIDRQYGEWMEIWTELSCPPGKIAALDLMNHAGTVPLQFFFCRQPGLALPLIALQYHEVKLSFDFKYEPSDVQLWVDYVYLDTDERRRFAQVQHNILIEQIQQQDGSGNNVRLNFNHPCKEIIWVSENSNFSECTIKLNGHERFAPRNFEYFNKVQPYQYHTNVPLYDENSYVVHQGEYKIYINGRNRRGNGSTSKIANWIIDRGYSVLDISDITLANLETRLEDLKKPPTDAGYTPMLLLQRNSKKRINVYSFALKPEEHQPSGTCNFSRIDNASLVNGNLGDSNSIYAVNYNVLRIMSGMAGLAFSN